MLAEIFLMRIETQLRLAAANAAWPVSDTRFVRSRCRARRRASPTERLEHVPSLRIGTCSRFFRLRIPLNPP